MEHDENAVINDANGTMGHDEGIVDADPKETTPNPYILACNMRVAQLKQQLAKVEGSAQNCEFLLNLSSHAYMERPIHNSIMDRAISIACIV
jgi:hypothetical protein